MHEHSNCFLIPVDKFFEKLHKEIPLVIPPSIKLYGVVIEISTYTIPDMHTVIMIVIDKPCPFNIENMELYNKILYPLKATAFNYAGVSINAYRSCRDNFKTNNIDKFCWRLTTLIPKNYFTKESLNKYINIQKTKQLLENDISDNYFITIRHVWENPKYVK